MSEPTRTLARKLAEVMRAVERIPKNGRNDFHKYDYATEADIVSAIRGELAQRNVVLIPGITGRTREAVGEKGQVLTHLDMSFTFYDGDSGEEITRPWLGAGADKEDKGAYKAMTGGEKYFLLKTFLIPTGDDPEAETAQPQRAPAQTRKPIPAAPKPATINATQAAHLFKIADKAGWKTDEVKAMLKTRYQVDSSKDIPVSKYEEVCKVLESGTEVGAR